MESIKRYLPIQGLWHTCRGAKALTHTELSGHIHLYRERPQSSRKGKEIQHLIYPSYCASLCCPFPGESSALTTPKAHISRHGCPHHRSAIPICSLCKAWCHLQHSEDSGLHLQEQSGAFSTAWNYEFNTLIFKLKKKRVGMWKHCLIFSSFS